MMVMMMKMIDDKQIINKKEDEKWTEAGEPTDDR